MSTSTEIDRVIKGFYCIRIRLHKEFDPYKMMVFNDVWVVTHSPLGDKIVDYR